MPSSIHRARSRSALAAAAACCALLAPAGPAAAADPQRPVCPPGYNLGALTFEETLELPRFQAALEAGVFTEESLAEGFTFFDANANGILCFKDVVGLEQRDPYVYLIIDDPGTG
jgi:hypothetical protein